VNFNDPILLLVFVAIILFLTRYFSQSNRNERQKHVNESARLQVDAIETMKAKATAEKTAIPLAVAGEATRIREIGRATAEATAALERAHGVVAFRLEKLRANLDLATKQKEASLILRLRRQELELEQQLEQIRKGHVPPDVSDTEESVS
jgi:hypothetical protein